MTVSVLAVQEVRHRLGERQVLDGVDLRVRSGDLTGLLGPNGAGKTTLMRILLGVIAADRGTVTIDGTPARWEDRRHWGYMPQARGLYPAMHAGEQVVHFGRLHGLTRRAAASRARRVMAELGLEDRWGDRTDRLSGGLQQRLQLAVTLVHDPDVLVLDEPFAGLDPLAVADLSEVLRERVHRGRVVLLSSHQLDLVQDLCRSILMLDHGRPVLAGSVADLRSTAGTRQLRLTTAAPRDWVTRFPGVRVTDDQADALWLTLPPGTDPLVVLDAARQAGPVSDFGLELPTLSQLFLLAARHPEPAQDAAEAVR